MAIITNYATLQTEVANFLSRDDLTADIPLFVQMAENELHSTLHLRNEETALNVSITSGVAAVPSDFKMLKFAYYDQTPVSLLQWMSIEDLYRKHPDRSESGIPCDISREGSNFVFGKVADDGTLRGIYYARQDPLRTTDPSWYVTNHPEVLLYGSLIQSQGIVPLEQQDTRLSTWINLYNRAVEAIQDEEDAAETSGGSLLARAS